MSCCKYCTYGKSSGSSDGVSYVDLQNTATTLRREMAYCIRDNKVDQELIIELQNRVKSLTALVNELKTKFNALHSYIARSGGYLVPSGNKPAQVQSPSVSTVITPYDTLSRYLIGDFENDSEGQGFQWDDQIVTNENVKPSAMSAYLPSTPLPGITVPYDGEEPIDPSTSSDPLWTRWQARIDTRNAFMCAGSEAGSMEAEMSEYRAMMQGPDMTEETRKAGVAILKPMYYQGVTNGSEGSEEEGNT